MTVIDYAPTEPQDVVVEGRGWRQTTPVKGGRFYEDTAQTCELAEATDAHFASLTHTLRTCFPTDFTGPTKWNVARAAVHQQIEWRSLPDDQAVRWLVDQADVTLNAAADRGSAIHRALEARLLGQPVDHEDLARNGATEYLAAVDAFLAAAKPEPALVETVAFSRANLTACTLDFLGDLPGLGVRNAVVDWKSRTKNHDRRPKEAAQLGGIVEMARDGYYMDDRGYRRQAEIDATGIVTFAPDGTWAWHPVEPDVALASWTTALAMRPHTLVSNVYGKATRGETLDVPALTKQRFAAIERDTPEWMGLAKAWTQHGLPQQSADLTIDDWPTVDALLTRFEPFPTTERAPVTYVTADEVRDVKTRLAALPPDLAAEVLRTASGLPDLVSPVLTTDDLEDWERALSPAESTAAGRLVAIGIILGQLDEEHPPVALAAVTVHFPDDQAAWTDDDITRCAELVDAYLAGDLILRHGALIVSPRVIEGLPKLEFRMKAKTVAEAIGRPTPKKFGDVVDDLVLYAATRAA